jgi:uncharacterized protein
VSYVGEKSLGRSVVVSEDSGQPGLLGSRCPSCGDVRFPARLLCANDLEPCEPHHIDGLGTVYEVVRMRLAPVGFAAPYWAGYIDLDAGVRVFAQVAHTEGQPDPAHGDRVRLTVGVVSQAGGQPVHGPIFERTPGGAVD